MAFEVDEITFRPLEEWKDFPRAVESVEAGRPQKEDDETRNLDRRRPNFLGSMKVAWMMEDYCAWKNLNYTHLSDMYHENLERRIQDRWMEDFQNLVLKGLTYGNPGKGELWWLGTYEKRGEK